MQPKIATITQFKAKVQSLTNPVDVFDIFEDGCTEELREEIYALSAHLDSNEPFREAMHILGFTEF